MAEIVESCLLALERGARIDSDAIVSANPDLSVPLRKCLTSLVTLHDAVHGSEETLPGHPSLTAGGCIGEFVLEEMIGRGGMGVVYAAYQKSLDRRVALKVLPHSALLQPSQLQRFLLEAKAVAQLHHGNIVPIYTVGQEADLHYYTMQLIDGESLDKLPPGHWDNGRYREFLTTAIDLTDALRHAHTCGIIHRDIKPSNLLLDRNNKVWITDFGLARCKHETSFTLTGDLLGTVNYMSPEQALGKPVDERTDIYSLGVTLFEMLAGKQAFPGHSRNAVLRSIENDEPPSLRKLRPDVPYDLETVILKAMSKDREERYSSAAEMLYDLEAIHNGMPIDGRRPSPGRRMVRCIIKHRVLASFVGFSLLGITGMLVVMGQLREAQLASTRNLGVAKDTYWQGRNLVERWNKDLIQRLADIPGAEPIHAQMLSETIDYYQWFLDGKAPSDPKLAPDIADARMGLALALEQQGNVDAAIENYRLAIEQLENLPIQGVPLLAAKLIRAQNDLAVVFLRAERSREAVQQLHQAQHILERFRSKTPIDVSYQAALFANLAKAQSQMGNTYDETGAIARAEGLYRDALEQEPSNPEIQSELAAVLDHRALLLADYELELAVQLSGEAVSLHQQANHRNQSAKRYQRWGASLHNHAALLHRAGRIDASRATFHQAIEVKSSLTRLAPTRLEFWHDLVSSYNGIGQLEYHARAWSKAHHFFELAESTIRETEVITSKPMNTASRILLAETLCSSIEARAHGGMNSDDHRDELRRALMIISKTATTATERDSLRKLRLRWCAIEPLEAKRLAGAHAAELE